MSIIVSFPDFWIPWIAIGPLDLECPSFGGGGGVWLSCLWPIFRISKRAVFFSIGLSLKTKNGTATIATSKQSEINIFIRLRRLLLAALLLSLSLLYLLWVMG